ncbi:MAG TPA: HAMP domain-containing sensor histidine kinase [Xanthobacteraceae bacterium]|nr:HAMP domain-containing sensor histidine kinase [Xanthobacteraceae bacterium]
MIALHRSGAVRIALLFLGLFACTVVAAFALTYTLVRQEIVDHLRLNIVAGADAMAARLASEPPEEVLSSSSRQRVAALFDADGKLIYGERGLSPFVGWQEIPADSVGLQEEPEYRSMTVMVYGRRVGQLYLSVGEGMDIVEDSREALTSGLLWSLAFVLMAGLAGALVIAWRIDRRLGRTEVALNAYASGDMTRRLPLAGSGDELDRVSASVNTVLDRLTGLIETTRQITTDAAHDLKTPMTRLLHRLAEAEGTSAAESKMVLRSAAAEAKQIIATFDALLRIAEIEAGARRARFDLVDLSEVIETVADAYGPEAEQAGQRLETKIGSGLLITGDRDLLTQAFADLVENAIRHAGAGAVISLMATSHDAGVEAMVCDTGPGVPAADRERVLKRFVRLEASRSTPGTGLGLTLVKAIADLHNARLELGDNHPGLRVTLAFPQAPAMAKSAAA